MMPRRDGGCCFFLCSFRVFVFCEEQENVAHGEGEGGREGEREADSEGEREGGGNLHAR